MKLFSPLAVLLAMSSLIMIDCDSIKMSNVYIKWTINGNQTDFEVRSSLDKQLSLTNAWLSFGFSSQMNPTNVVVCKSKQNSSSIEHYYSNNTLLLASNPTVGITNKNVTILNNELVCAFTRENSIDVKNYFKMSQHTLNTYLIAAFGSFKKKSDELDYHYFAAKSVSFVGLGLNVSSDLNQTTSAQSLVLTQLTANNSFSHLTTSSQKNNTSFTLTSMNPVSTAINSTSISTVQTTNSSTIKNTTIFSKDSTSTSSPSTASSTKTMTTTYLATSLISKITSTATRTTTSVVFHPNVKVSLKDSMLHFVKKLIASIISIISSFTKKSQ